MASRYNRPGGFGCDHRTMMQLQEHLIRRAARKGIRLQFAPCIEGNTDRIDLKWTAHTLTEDIEVSAEVKERPDTGITYFQQNAPIIETGKTEALALDRIAGRQTYFFYIFKDGDYAVWEITDDTKLVDLGEKMVKPHTQGYLQEKKQSIHKWGLPLKAALYIGNIND